MFIKSTIGALALTSSLVMPTTAQAVEVSVEDIVTSLVNQAMVITTQEVQYGVQAAVLTATNSLSFNEEKTYVAKVTITDIKTEESDKKKAE
ncbi:MAG: hypothetical protein GW763_06600 [Paraglaciecola sp.]|nr:hypothetical protein [Paraglaciecola sp.]NCT47654.1 hypothetical protein [Paraglaciecola sp.]